MRSNNRLHNQIRTISCSSGILNAADGSAKFSLGNSTIIAGVFGPVPVPIKLEKIDSAQVVVSLDPLSGTAGVSEKTLADQIKNSIIAMINKCLFPRSSIQINLQILAQDGLILPVALNAAILACIDAGIPINGMVGAISICVNGKGEILLDPDQGEIESCVSRHVFAFEEKSNQLVLQESWGTFSIQDVIIFFKNYRSKYCKKWGWHLVKRFWISLEQQFKRNIQDFWNHKIQFNQLLKDNFQNHY